MSLLARVRLYEYEAGNAREVHCLLKKKKKKRSTGTGSMPLIRRLYLIRCSASRGTVSISCHPVPEEELSFLEVSWCCKSLPIPTHQALARFVLEWFTDHSP